MITLANNDKDIYVGLDREIDVETNIAINEDDTEMIGAVISFTQHEDDRFPAIHISMDSIENADLLIKAVTDAKAILMSVLSSKKDVSESSKDISEDSKDISEASKNVDES